MKEATSTYEDVAEILNKHHQTSNKPLTTREIRALLGNRGCLTRISAFSKRYYEEHPSSSPVNSLYSEKIQTAANQITTIITNTVRDITIGLEERLTSRDEDIDLFNSELNQREDHIKVLAGELAAEQERRRLVEAELTITKEAFNGYKVESTAEKKALQEELQKALQEAAFYRGKLEGKATSGSTDNDDQPKPKNPIKPTKKS